MASATPVPTSYVDAGDPLTLNLRNINIRGDTASTSFVASSDAWFSTNHHLRETCLSASSGRTPEELEDPQRTIETIKMGILKGGKGLEITSLYSQRISLSFKVIEMASEKTDTSSNRQLLLLDLVKFREYLWKAEDPHKAKPATTTKANQDKLLETTIYSCTALVLEVLDRKINALGGVGDLSRSSKFIDLAKCIYIERLIDLWGKVDEGETDVVVVQRLRETYRAALNFRNYFSKVQGLENQMSESLTFASQALEKVGNVTDLEKKDRKRT